MAKKKKRKQNNYPVGLFALDEEDHEYWHADDNKRCPRVMIEQIDGDKFYFTDEAKARKFIELHGLSPISNEELEQLRANEAPSAADDEEMERGDDEE